MKRILIALAVAASVATAPAFAASERFEMAVQVDTAKLETPRGALVEYERIKGEVAERCAAEHKDFPFGGELATSICAKNTMKSVVQKIANPNFTAAQVTDAVR